MLGAFAAAGIPPTVHRKPNGGPRPWARGSMGRGGNDPGACRRPPDGTWAEVEDGKAVRNLSEAARTPRVIEIFDAGRNTRCHRVPVAGSGGAEVGAVEPVRPPVPSFESEPRSSSKCSCTRFRMRWEITRTLKWVVWNSSAT